MALIVEDGTSVEDAESYISVEGADTYHTGRGANLWFELTVEEKEQALRRATEYMVGEYRDRWLGRRTSATQALDWPRTGVYLSDLADQCRIPTTFVPRDVKAACASLALRAAAGELVEDTDQKIIEETIGPITTKWDPKSSTKRKYPQIDSMLKIFMSGGGNPFMATLVRT